MPGNDWVVVEHEQNFRVGGGRESSRFGLADDAAYLSEGAYLDIVPGARIITAGTMHDDGARITATMSTVELYPEGGGTRLVFTNQSVFFDQETEADRASGWGEIMNRLSGYLERAAHAKET